MQIFTNTDSNTNTVSNSEWDVGKMQDLGQLVLPLFPNDKNLKLSPD